MSQKPNDFLLFSDDQPLDFGLLSQQSPPADANLTNEPVYNGSADPARAVGASGNILIDALLAGISWSDGSISYSDPDSSADYGPGYFYDDDSNGISVQNQGFSRSNAQQVRAAHFALNADLFTQPAGAIGFSVEGFTNLVISYAGAGAGTGTIRLANSTDPRTNTAYAFYPGGNLTGGDAWFDQSGTTPVVGNYHWATLLHELGHTLGLKHGHETTTYGALPSAFDSLEFSIMTYRSFVGDDINGYSNETFGYPQTYMMCDIAALQYMYGADFSVNGGSTVYAWDPNTGQSFVNGVLALDPGGNRIFSTIWDGAGNDTYDLSNYSTNLRIDLHPGESSSFSTVQLADLGGGPNNGHARGNVFNALPYMGNLSSLIENAIGGNGHDSIVGNSVGNILRGNGGNDVINGDDGFDTAVYGGTRSQYALSLVNGSIQITDLRGGSPDGTDAVSSIEYFQFADRTYAIAEVLTAMKFVNFIAQESKTGDYYFGYVYDDTGRYTTGQTVTFAPDQVGGDWKYTIQSIATADFNHQDVSYRGNVYDYYYYDADRASLYFTAFGYSGLVNGAPSDKTYLSGVNYLGSDHDLALINGSQYYFGDGFSVVPEQMKFVNFIATESASGDFYYGYVYDNTERYTTGQTLSFGNDQLGGTWTYTIGSIVAADAVHQNQLYAGKVYDYYYYDAARGSLYFTNFGYQGLSKGFSADTGLWSGNNYIGSDHDLALINGMQYYFGDHYFVV